MKKVFAVLMAIMMTSIPAFAENMPTDFKEVKHFGIMQQNEDGSMNFAAPVTRAEMAQITVNAAGLSGISASLIPTEGFNDVGENHWAYNAIILAQSSKIINGYGDGTFCPNNSVTYEEALKMIVMLLGYEPLASQKGGYPSGYIAVAKQIGLTDGIEFENSDVASRYDIACLMERALNTPIMQQVSYGSNAEYIIFDGKDNRELITLKNNLE